MKTQTEQNRTELKPFKITKVFLNSFLKKEVEKVGYVYIKGNIEILEKKLKNDLFHYKIFKNHKLIQEEYIFINEIENITGVNLK